MPELPRQEAMHGLVRAMPRRLGRGMGADSDWESEGDGGSGFDWGRLIDSGFKFTTDIVALNRGASLQRSGPGSNTAINTPFFRNPLASQGISTTTLLIGGAAVLAVVLMAGRK